MENLTFDIEKNPSKELLDALKEGKQIEQEIREGKRSGYKNVDEMLKSIINDKQKIAETLFFCYNLIRGGLWLIYTCTQLIQMVSIVF